MYLCTCIYPSQVSPCTCIYPYTCNIILDGVKLMFVVMLWGWGLFLKLIYQQRNTFPILSIKGGVSTPQHRLIYM